MSFLKKSAWSFTSVAARALGSLAANKLFAIYFGTAGLSLLAHFQNLISMLTQIPNDGIHRGLMTFLADEKLSSDDRNQYLSSALVFNGLLFAITFGVLVSLDELFFSDFIFHLNAAVFYSLFFLASLLFLLNLFLQSIVLAGQQLRTYAICNVLGVLAMLLILYSMLESWKLDYVLLAFLFGQSASLLFFGYYVYHKKLIRPQRMGFSKPHFRELFQFVLMAGSVLLFGKLLDFLVRDEVIEQFGLQQTGLWQSVVRISELYTMLFIATVGAVYYPQLSALANTPRRLKQYFWQVFRLIAPATALGLLTVYLLRNLLLELLFSADFSEASDLFSYHLLGDWFLLMAYLLVYLLSVQSRTKAFILSQAFSAFLYLAALSLFMQELSGLPMAHALRGAAYFVLLVILNRKLIF